MQGGVNNLAAHYELKAVNIALGSVAACLMCDEIFINHFITNLLWNVITTSYEN